MFLCWNVPAYLLHRYLINPSMVSQSRLDIRTNKHEYIACLGIVGCSAVLHGLSMFAVKAKIYGVPIISPALSLLMQHLFIGQRQKAPNFSVFHWSPHGSLVSIGQHFVTTRVVHLPKRTETSLITEWDRSGPNHRIGPGCA